MTSSQSTKSHVGMICHWDGIVGGCYITTGIKRG